jgi:hypothetical protein
MASISQMIPKLIRKASFGHSGTGAPLELWLRDITTLLSAACRPLMALL